MPFWMKTRVGPWKHVLDGAQISQEEGAIYGGCPRQSKALTIFATAIAATSLRRSLQTEHSIDSNVMHATKGIIQYTRQAPIVFWKFLGPGDAA